MVANCKSQLKECHGSEQLGESAQTEDIKHTAEEEDRIARGEEIPVAAQKAKDKSHPARDIRNTAVQEYIKKQKKSPYHLYDQQAGTKLPKDRLDAKSVKTSLGSLNAAIALDKQEDAKEDAAVQKAVEDANKRSLKAEQ